MTEYRSEEVLHALDAMIQLNEQNIQELEDVGLSFVGKLDTEEIHLMGHSFGGATALHAARKRQPASIIAHEPATEWIPDGTRGSIFDLDRLHGSSAKVPSYVSKTPIPDALNTSVHDMEMLVLFSGEWETKDTGGVEIFKDLCERGLMGPKGGISKVKVIPGAFHQEFSDTCMLTPVWLARASNLTGSRNPLDTAREIHEATLEFLNSFRERQSRVQ